MTAEQYCLQTEFPLGAKAIYAIRRDTIIGRHTKREVVTEYQHVNVTIVGYTPQKVRVLLPNTQMIHVYPHTLTIKDA